MTKTIITDINQLDLNGRYSVADYLSWQFEEMVELIRGKIFKMSAPRSFHQILSSNLHGEMYVHFKKHKCRLIAAPFDVYLTPEGAEKATIVQPDIVVVCDTTKIDERGCKGVPDLVVEILSRSTAKKDLNEKFDLYEEVGVQEYLIVDPDNKLLFQYFLNAATLQYELQNQRPFTVDKSFTSRLFPEMTILLSDIFDGEAES